MKRESSPHGASAPIPARLAWWVCFAATLTVLLVLGATRAQAAIVPLPGGAPTLAAAAEEPLDELAEDEGPEEEWEVEDCEVVGEGEEEEEICEGEEAEGEVPAACRLRSTEALVSANPASGKVRLQVRYTTSSPSAVEVDYFLRGRKGPLSFDDRRQRFGKSGVFRASAALDDQQMEKVLAAKSFTVQLHATGAPRSCDPHFDSTLSLRRDAGKALTWSDPASARRGA